MKHYEELRVIAKSDKSILERGDMIIKDMCRLTQDILNYRYTCEKYKGDNASVIEDKMNSIKNTMGILISDLDIYMEVAEIKDSVNNKAVKRIHKVADKLTKI